MKRFIFALSLLGIFNAASAQDMSTFSNNKVVAHRGAWKTAGLPQNSMASLKRAIALGCAGTEFDVHLTADGTLILCHDNSYKGLIIEKSSYAKLIEKPLANGEKLPTLQEILDEGMKQHNTKLFLEIKSSSNDERTVHTAERAVELVKEMGAEDLVFYIAFSYNAVKRIAELQPNAPVAYLNGDVSPQQLKEDGIFGLDYNLQILKKHPEWIQQAKDLGININVWTVNKPEDMDWLLQQGVDYITTDEPEVLLTKYKL